MSIRANPTAIGLFLIGAAVLAIVGTATLASVTWFQKRSTFVSFFQETVNGLEVGAPVKFQGVPVGSVTAILISIDVQGKTFQVPVEYQVDLERLTTQSGAYVNLSNPTVRRQQIADGLRAQLQTESIVTGQLYIELRYASDPKPPELQRVATRYPEIPTTPSLMATLGTGAGSLVADVMKILFQVNEMLADVNMPEINAAVVASANAVQRLVESPEIHAALDQVPGLTAQTERTLAAVELLASRAEGSIGPFQEQLGVTNAELVATMKAMRRTLDETHGLLSADSGVGYELQQTLASMQAAADALRQLAQALEQNPDMLLRGKKPPEE